SPTTIRTPSAAAARSGASTSSTTAPGPRSAATAIPPRRRRPSRIAAPRCFTRARARRRGRCAGAASALEPFHHRARHDVVPAGLVPPDPGLVAAVVVGREQDERRLLLPHAAAVTRLRV